MSETQPIAKVRIESLTEPGETAGRASRGKRTYGIFAALTSAIFLGMTPIFGKQAILYGASPLAVVTIRTVLAFILLLLVMTIFYRPYLYIYPAGLLGCLLAGAINGLGSIFYYSSLGRIEASVGQLLYSLYPLFLVLWLSLDHQLPGRLTIVRLILAMFAVYLLIGIDNNSIDIIGVLEMLIASALYALHIPINQRVLYDMPAPTVTVYTLLAMSMVVAPAFLLSPTGEIPTALPVWIPIFGLTLVTFFSRLTLFLGVKHLGGMQTALLGLSEIIITLFFAHVWLGERLNFAQWIGAILMITSLLLVIIDKRPTKNRGATGWLSWLRPPAPPSDISWRPHD
jgi:drug/metabolite transporter (DMT)-like permease